MTRKQKAGKRKHMHTTACTSALLVLTSVGFAQNQSNVLPRNYKPIFENADVSVLRAHYGPHEKIPLHDHPAFDTVFVYLNDSGVVKLSHMDGPVQGTVNRPPTHTGAFRIAPGRPERHSVENLGDVPADSVLVQVKTQPAGTISHEFRGPAPTQPLLTGTTVVYDSPTMKIERVICDPGATCTLEAEGSPSLLVGITPTALMGGKQGQMLTFDQPAGWLPAGEHVGARSAGPVPAQVLRIVLIRH
jgi:hypothetical protein